ncbi:hypothetical protein [Streptomyces sp. ST2-7A]|uniref:hypothetical protein n=1 Tax=Streptomyces sp. ST2-7A TaxID=2907214 RepID=UPI001F29B903|nr:hypothetical protein [Streptomyces sp. ST2-7A]MCE7080713.1 hypothetical protein [Streptomyces sp. ST2-7A]
MTPPREPYVPASERITLMAAGELRDALTAHRAGDTAAAVAALMSIDPDSWAAIERRLAAMGGTVTELLPDTH